LGGIYEQLSLWANILKHINISRLWYCTQLLGE